MGNGKERKLILNREKHKVTGTQYSIFLLEKTESRFTSHLKMLYKSVN